MQFIFIIIGILTILGTYYKPAFYWESRKAVALRRIIGDTATEIFYYIIGIGITVAGILATFGLVSVK